MIVRSDPKAPQRDAREAVNGAAFDAAWNKRDHDALVAILLSGATVGILRLPRVGGER